MRSPRALTGDGVVSQRTAAPPWACARGLRRGPRRVSLPALCVVVAGGLMFAGAADAQEAVAPGALSSMTMPGGVRQALAALDDPAAPDRGHFLLELIRRSHRTPIGASDPHDPFITSLLGRLDVAGPAGGARPHAPDTLPLPLPAAVWTEAVFGGRATPQTLASAILGSRSAALFYYGLFSLDDPTRAWLASQPALVTELSSRHSAAFVLAAPGLRVADGVVHVPGGGAAIAAWEAVVGRQVKQPADFMRELLTAKEGRLAYFFGSIAQLPPALIRLALRLDAEDGDARVAAMTRLLAVFERIGGGWAVDARTFWRPALDPALLLADLPAEEPGSPRLPFTRTFWQAVFHEEARRSTVKDEGHAIADRTPLDFAWLCDQVFQGEPAEHKRRYHQVLFAARLRRHVAPDREQEAIEAVRAAGEFPSLVAVLERARLVDVSAYVQAARRATQLTAIDEDSRAVRSVTQFQGLLALVVRAVSRGSIPSDSLASYVTSLSAVTLSEKGDYEGRLVRWAEEHLRQPAVMTARGLVAVDDAPVGSAVPSRTPLARGPIEDDLLRLLAGRADAEPRFVEWEGTRYRVDLSSAEAVRLTRLLGEEPRPYLSSARAVLGVADALGEAGLTSDGLRGEAQTLEGIARQVGWKDDEDWLGTDTVARYQAVAGPLQRLGRAGASAGAARLVPMLRDLADDLLARGLLELTYATALGQPDRAWVSARDTAMRHDFGLRASNVRRRGAPWRLPAAGGDTMRGWRVVGSLLGLEVRLAEFSLMRLSSKPPARRPSVNEDQRRTFVEGVALVEPRTLTEEDRETIVSAIQKGRATLAALRTADEAAALADEIGLSPARRSLLPWVLAHEPARLAAFLSPVELFWLGLEKRPVEARFQVWGVPGESRLGCLCLQIVDRRAWETLAGRWGTGIFASGFPDLNLRLAELLSELHMPAALLGPVLSAAMLDFINGAVSRDQDDRRGLVEFVQALNRERVEQYLALLTTDGPLVPVGEAPDRTGKTTDRHEKRGEPR